jgi:LmbE family N-acetylglucosaminyl deacetylase
VIGTSIQRNGELNVLCLGAHCDDIEIGCGGTLMTLLASRPQTKIHWVVFSSDDVREAESRHAANVLLDGRVELSFFRYRNGYFPAQWADIKDAFEQLKRALQPGLVLSHALEDRHQDHRVVAELTWNTFRDHLIWEYEIAKYEGDLGRTNTFVPLTKQVLSRKCKTLMESFPSQHGHQWFNEDTFGGLARIRGIECNASEGVAEAFFARKNRVSF